MSLIYDVHNSWKGFFTNEIIQELNDIENKIGDNYFPQKENVLRFAQTDLNKIKCVIVGMEPYPSSFKINGKIVPEATGRSFEVNSLRDKTWCQKFKQSSLRNILKAVYFNETSKIKSLDEIRTEIENNTFKISQPGEWFDNLEKQGVLFLNATLTVIPNSVDTHTKIWEEFMNKLIPYIDKKNVKWLLWGNKARERVLPFINSDNAICSCHPRLAEFVNDNPFKYVKDIKWT